MVTPFDDDAISDYADDVTEEDSRNNFYETSDTVSLFPNISLQDMDAIEISERIIKVLQKCPNTSCSSD
ncbi:MAG: hypothetical protein LBU35_00100 [Holosporales bacterium]|jgi:hypothetical protein|nr:hypothetical protein [Holosporales bacterium]